MSFRTWTPSYIGPCSDWRDELRDALDRADAVLVGAGSGLSTSAGLTYGGERFARLFADFIEVYHFSDMYSGGFYRFPTPEERWAWWSRVIACNRYVDPPKPVYRDLCALLQGRDAFVLTTNVDHQFQRAGFPKERLFYTQGDYGLWQCSVPCHDATYDNEQTVRRMVETQRNRRVPTELLPRCPVCGRPMTMNLRADDTFVEDAGWHAAAARYADFLRRQEGRRLLLLELGVGGNTPGIIKFPFWRIARDEPLATYACINAGEAFAPRELAGRAICVQADIGEALAALAEK